MRKPLHDLDAAEKEALQRVVYELKATIAQIK
ncbi:dihydrodipicolinate synthetase [Pseudomonas putida S11]|nr:dihydrodipicolinate synthetase [Pseudomonas putida S11]